MDFAAAWAAFSAGSQVKVSNGLPAPAAAPDSLPFRIWRSHNFTGALAEKIAGTPRAMRFNLPPNASGSVIGFTVREGDGHRFDLA